MNPTVVAAIINGVLLMFGGVIGAFITAFFLFRGTNKTVQTTKEVKDTDAYQDLLKQTREELQAHRTDIATLRKEYEEERKARHALEDTVQEMKVKISNTEADLVREKDERKRIQLDYEEAAVKSHDETLFLQNKVAFLEEENRTLKARVQELESQLGKAMIKT